MSSSKEKILQAIRAIALEEKALPPHPDWSWDSDYLKSFTSLMDKLSTSWQMVSSKEEAEAIFQSQMEEGKLYYNGLADTPIPAERPHQWDQLEAVLLVGAFGVAENAAIWVPETAMVDRVIPFICKHLYLIIHVDALVGNMHEAYAKIEQENYGYGVFISGPSKTADIEQSLVIGAHGPLALTVLLLSK